MDTVLAICLGIGLSAACGFRVFVPLLVMSVASLSGHLTLAPGFQWIGTYPGLITFSVATVVEIQWPSGQTDKLTNVNAGQTVTVQEGKGIVSSRAYGAAGKKPVATKVAKLSAEKH